MKAVYVHLSPHDLPFDEKIITDRYTFANIPDYASVSFAQSERLLGCKSIIISNDYINDVIRDEVREFFEICKYNFITSYNKAFWLTTLLRLYVVQLYCEKNNINEFIHLEYDNLIYSDLSYLKSLPKSIYFTQVGPYVSSAGFVYCNSNKHFNFFTDRLLKLISLGEQTLKQHTTDPNVSEMSMIDLIYRSTTDVMRYLPILPESTDYSLINTIFDGASYGQFIGGTNAGDQQGWYGLHHYVGQAIHTHRIFPYFDALERRPYLIHNKTRIPIANLHVHSKQLELYV